MARICGGMSEFSSPLKSTFVIWALFKFANERFRPSRSAFQLANTDTRTLQACLGHRNIQHTVRYTELSPTRFKNL